MQVASSRTLRGTETKFRNCHVTPNKAAISHVLLVKQERKNLQFLTGSQHTAILDRNHKSHKLARQLVSVLYFSSHVFIFSPLTFFQLVLSTAGVIRYFGRLHIDFFITFDIIYYFRPTYYVCQHVFTADTFFFRNGNAIPKDVLMLFVHSPLSGVFTSISA